MDNIDFSDPVQVERGFSLISNELKSLKNDATVEKENHDTLVSAIQNNPEIIRLIASDSTTNSNGLKRHIAQNYPDLHRTVSKAMNDDDDAEDNNKEKKAKKAMSDDKKMDAETKATISIAKNSIIKELVSSFEKIHPDNGTDHTRENKILDYKASLEVKPLVALAEELDDPYRIALVAKHEEELARTTTTAGSTVSTPKPQNIPFNGNPYSMTVGSASSPKKPLLARAGQTLEDMLDDNAGGMYQ